MADDGNFPSPKQILAAHGLHARKRLGQNFLVDPRFAQRIAGALPDRAFVVEIGAGTGSLTAAIAQRARSIVALEIDRGLAAVLRERFESAGRVAILEGDALEFDMQSAFCAQTKPRAICGNLPYYVTTPIIERILDASACWESAVLMVQREYAKRLVAKPGTSDYASLTAFVGYHCDVEKLFDVGAAGFYPAPTVASAVVRLTPRPDRSRGVHDEALLLRTVRAAFSQRRKTLANCLASVAKHGTTDSGSDRRDDIEAAIRSAGLDPAIRGERLSLDDFRRLANALAAVRVALI